MKDITELKRSPQYLAASEGSQGPVDGVSCLVASLRDSYPPKLVPMSRLSNLFKLALKRSERFLQYQTHKIVQTSGELKQSQHVILYGVEATKQKLKDTEIAITSGKADVKMSSFQDFKVFWLMLDPEEVAKTHEWVKSCAPREQRALTAGDPSEGQIVACASLSAAASSSSAGPVTTSKKADKESEMANDMMARFFKPKAK